MASTASPDATGSLTASLQLGAVRLTVADLRRSVAHYEGLGFVLRAHEGGTARLGTAARELLVLEEEPGARPFPERGATGLFHLAILLPTRAALGRFLVHLSRTRTPVTGMSDHLVSEAIYLRDPDGHGLEVYADRPRASWPHDVDGTLQMATLPLDTEAIVAELEEAPPAGFTLPDGTTMGHVHLHVADLDAATAFWTRVVGLSPIVRLGGQASFLSAGGYHHHVGLNVWAGRGVPPAPAGTARLRHVELGLPDAPARDALLARLRAAGTVLEDVDGAPAFRDPSANLVRVAVLG